MRQHLIIFCLIFQCSILFSQEQVIHQQTKNGNLEGTLLVPTSINKIPLVVIISGSGPTDRNGNQDELENNSLKLIADTLFCRGIASFRFDKRGIGASKSAATSERELRFEDFVNDVKNWITLTSTDKRFSKIFVAGHSEGSLIGMLASENNKKVEGFISIAGPGCPADEVLKEQLAKSEEGAKKTIYSYIDRIKSGDTIANVPYVLYSLFRPSIQRYMTSWFKYDPRAEIKKLKIPILILQGNMDMQVKVKDAELLHEASPESKISIIQNMNHVLKFCDTLEREIQLKTYDNPKLPLDKIFCQDLVSFIGLISGGKSLFVK